MGAFLSGEKVGSWGLEVLLRFKLLLPCPFIQCTEGMCSASMASAKNWVVLKKKKEYSSCPWHYQLRAREGHLTNEQVNPPGESGQPMPSPKWGEGQNW